MTLDTQDGALQPGRAESFDGGRRTLLAFGVWVATLGVLAVLVGNAVAGIEFPAWVGPVAAVGKWALFALSALVLLRIEGVRPVELGLSKRDLLIAVGVGTGVYLGLNLVGAALAAVSGAPWGLAVLLEQPTRWTGVPAPLAVSLAADFLVVALVEEFVFRGYLQSKLIARFGDDTWWRVGAGILVASLVFGVLHAPGAIVAGASLGEVLLVLAMLSMSGLAFGLLYELTGNIYFVAVLHAIGNTWMLVADVWSLPGTALIAWILSLVLVYGAATVACRRWSGLSPGRSVGDPLSVST